MLTWMFANDRMLRDINRTCTAVKAARLRDESKESDVPLHVNKAGYAEKAAAEPLNSDIYPETSSQSVGEILTSERTTEKTTKGKEVDNKETISDLSSQFHKRKAMPISNSMRDVEDEENSAAFGTSPIPSKNPRVGLLDHLRADQDEDKPLAPSALRIRQKLLSRRVIRTVSIDSSATAKTNGKGLLASAVAPPTAQIASTVASGSTAGALPAARKKPTLRGRRRRRWRLDLTAWRTRLVTSERSLDNSPAAAKLDSRRIVRKHRFRLLFRKTSRTTISQRETVRPRHAAPRHLNATDSRGLVRKHQLRLRAPRISRITVSEHGTARLRHAAQRRLAATDSCSLGARRRGPIRYLLRAFAINNQLFRRVSLSQETRYRLRLHEYMERKRRMLQPRRRFEEKLDRGDVWSALKAKPGDESFLPPKVRSQRVDEEQAQNLLDNIRAYLGEDDRVGEAVEGHREEEYKPFRDSR